LRLDQYWTSAAIQRPEWAVRLIAKLTSDFMRDEMGATAIEYALIASGISVVIVAAVIGIGGELRDRFEALTGLF
jgi:pilus assembly protein Flp/PilA